MNISHFFPLFSWQSTKSYSTISTKQPDVIHMPEVYYWGPSSENAIFFSILENVVDCGKQKIKIYKNLI